jgi:hypothetical protein
MRNAQMLYGNYEPNPNSLYENMVRETPIGSVDGVNKIFTLSFTPVVNSDEIYINGQLRYPTLAYLLSGNIITFVSAPWNGSLILAKYVKKT